MDGQVFIRPKYKGSIVRDPSNMSVLSENGELKPWNGREGTYWRRRVNDGSCIVMTEEEIKKLQNKIEDARKKQVEEDRIKFDEEGNIIKRGGK
jgi:hypothetical protein